MTMSRNCKLLMFPGRAGGSACLGEVSGSITAIRRFLPSPDRQGGDNDGYDFSA
jgi:hypothetical protein